MKTAFETFEGARLSARPKHQAVRNNIPNSQDTSQLRVNGNRVGAVSSAWPHPVAAPSLSQTPFQDHLRGDAATEIK